MTRPRNDNTKKLNVTRINVDLSDARKKELSNYKNKHYSGHMSAWLSSMFDSFLDNGGTSEALTEELIAFLDADKERKYNNLGFYISPEQLIRLDILCSKSMRNRKQYATLFIYSLYANLILHN